VPNPFVWFDLRTPAKDAARRFYSSPLGLRDSFPFPSGKASWSHW
jgi:predicted enzyme related to lactoylglutathione lyase